MIMAFGASDWQWMNPPRQWTADDGLSLFCDAGTDLWRRTHYGYTFDNAHLFGRVIPGDLRVAVTFSGDYADQYDQAGAVLRIDEENWIKAGVEFVDGAFHLSTVVTREVSDWSVLPLPVTLPVTPPVTLPVTLPMTGASVTFELVRQGDSVTVRYGLADEPPLNQVRLAYFPPGRPALAGAMACAPVGKGFTVRFTDVSITAV